MNIANMAASHTFEVEAILISESLLQWYITTTVVFSIKQGDGNVQKYRSCTSLISLDVGFWNIVLW